MPLGAQAQLQATAERIADALEHGMGRDADLSDRHLSDCPACAPLRAEKAAKKAADDKVKADAEAARIAKEDAERKAREKANEPTPPATPGITAHAPTLAQSRQAAA